MEAVVWSNEQISLLIELYYQRSLLWDTSNKEYKDRFKKNDAWADIAKQLNISQKEVETKIHILRSQFSREKKKYFKTGSDGDQVNKSKWLWYDALQFLLCGATATSGSADTMTTDEIASTATQPPPPQQQSNNPQKRKCDEDFIEAYETRKCPKIDVSKDEFEIYAQYVTSELRHVKDEHSRLQAKYHINKILLKARMGYYSEYGDGWHVNGNRSTSSTRDTSTPNQISEPASGNDFFSQVKLEK